MIAQSLAAKEESLRILTNDLIRSIGAFKSGLDAYQPDEDSVSNLDEASLEFLAVCASANFEPINIATHLAHLETELDIKFQEFMKKITAI